jgi:hypothetical protein
MKSDELKALCQYCLRPCTDIWHVRAHIRKYHANLIREIEAASGSDPVAKLEEELGTII